MGGDGRGLAAMTFLIPPRPPPPPRLLLAEGEVLQCVVLYATSSVLRFLLFFLLVAIRLVLVLPISFRVVPPGVLLMGLLAKGPLAFLSVVHARRSDPVHGCKALHMQPGVGASAAHVLCVAFAAMCTSARLGAANGDVDGVSRLRIGTGPVAKEGPLPLPHAICATAPFYGAAGCKRVGRGISQQEASHNLRPRHMPSQEAHLQRHVVGRLHPSCHLPVLSNEGVGLLARVV